MLNNKLPLFSGIYLTAKGSVFLLVALFGPGTTLPTPVLGGLALTWLAGGAGLLWVARRVAQRLDPNPQAANKKRQATAWHPSIDSSA